MAGKTALVTGGTHGIGKSIAISLARAGCNVAVFSRDREKVELMNSILSKLCDKHICLIADTLNDEDCLRIISSITSSWGGVDILINNVGGGGRWGNECILETEGSVWKEVLDKNLFSSIKYTKSFLPHMIEKKWGRVICITSIYGKQIGGRPWFNLAKSSQNVLMKNLSQNKSYSGCNITFNSVAPGPIYIKNTGWADLERESPNVFQRYIEDNIPRGKMGTPEEVADVVLFLCSNGSALINGATIACDGGQGVCL